MTGNVPTCFDCVFFRPLETKRTGDCTFNVPTVRYVPEEGSWQTAPDPEVEMERPACQHFRPRFVA